MKTVKIEDEDHKRFTDYTSKSETYAQAFTRLLSEKPHITDLKEAFKTSYEKSERAKREGKFGLMNRAYGELSAACRKFIAEVEKR